MIMWTCKHCKEQVEDDFDSCWQCGYTKDGTAPSEPLEFEEPVEEMPTTPSHEKRSSMLEESTGQEVQSSKRTPPTLFGQPIVESTSEASEAPRRSRGGAKPSTALIKRYRDGYVVANATIGFGWFIKIAGIVLGFLIFIAFSDSRSNSGFLSGFIACAVVAGLFYMLGILISAVGQMLLATLDTALDTAVNTSQVLTEKQKMEIFSVF